jgi:hypothetical protein
MDSFSYEVMCYLKYSLKVNRNSCIKLWKLPHMEYNFVCKLLYLKQSGSQYSDIYDLTNDCALLMFQLSLTRLIGGSTYTRQSAKSLSFCVNL